MPPRNQNPNSEDAMIQQAAIQSLIDMGWNYENCYAEGGGEFFVTNRKHMGEVVLENRLRVAIEKLNPGIAESAVDSTMAEILKDRTSMDQVLANKEVYKMLRDGFPVSFLDAEGIRQDERLRIIDWKNAENNDFFVAEELWVTGDIYKRRADLVLYVNGLPLVVVELKASHKNIKKAYEDNITDYKNTIPQLFWYNAFIIVSNGTEAKFGTITSTWEFFHDWKRINNENETGRVDLETLLLGMCDKKKIIDYLENFILFQDVSGGTVKIGARNHQYHGVNKTFNNLDSEKAKAGQLGVFWHTQGSGKSFSMIFFAEKVLRKVSGNWTFVVVTDRLNLDKQIYENFASTGAVTEPDKHVRAASGKNLQQLLAENHRYIFTLIQKFQTLDGSVMETVSDRNNVIVMTDEAHRTQYDTLALNMRNALPNARYIGFTGTPLIAGEERTREVFGDYISTYDFQNAIKDGSTVPLYYQNRMPELNFQNDNFNEEIEKLVKEEDLTIEEERVLARKFASQYHLITNDERLNKVAHDIVEHFSSRGFLGKGMVISINKITTVKMYELVQKHWNERIKKLKSKLLQMKSNNDLIAYTDLMNNISWMEETDMAVVVSQEQNEEEKFRKAGTKIRPHRIRMNNQTEKLDDKFKNPKDPLRMVFVCAMWITGFDAPPLSTIYLDKPMRNHTLMQTIARANRVFGKKRNGIIVDYVGIFKNLKDALKIYTGGDDEEAEGGEGGKSPIQNVDELITEMNNISEQLISYSSSIGIDLKNIESLEKFDRLEALDFALEKILENEKTKNESVKLTSIFQSIYRAVMPDKQANDLLWLYRITMVLRDKIRNLGGEIDITSVLDQVKDIVKDSINVKDGRIGIDEKPILIGDIDFKALEKTFKDGKKKATLESIKVRLANKIQIMTRKNPLNINYREKFEKLIAEYNEGILSVDEIFEALRILSNELNKEEVRHEDLNLTEEELTIFDMLNRPGIDHADEKKETFKKAARSLIKKLKNEAFYIDWKKHQAGRANARVIVGDVLQDELDDILSKDEQKALKQEMFQFVYQSYNTVNDNVFSY